MNDGGFDGGFIDLINSMFGGAVTTLIAGESRLGSDLI